MPTYPQVTDRTCKKCGQTLPLAEGFWCANRKRGWYRHECRDCTRKRNHAWWRRNPDLAKATAKRQYAKRRDYLLSPEVRRGANERIRQRTAYFRAQVYAAYGNQCQCPQCPERLYGTGDPRFLTIDHVNNDGYLSRRRGGGSAGADLYRRLIRDDFPDTYQVLCFSCNLGKARNGGVCPHLDLEGSSTRE